LSPYEQSKYLNYGLFFRSQFIFTWKERKSLKNNCFLRRRWEEGEGMREGGSERRRERGTEEGRLRLSGWRNSDYWV
jgi:hypothetical protein